MEFLCGKTLAKKSKEEVLFEDAVKNKDVIGFYFSAHWCPPCRLFTPVLADMYEELMESNAPFEVIFVSSDRSSDAQFDYMEEAHGDWLTIPHGSDAIVQIQKKYNIKGIPALIIVKKDGTLVTENGRKDVESKGAQAFTEWAK